MRLFMGLLDLNRHYLGVALGGLKVPVAQKFLNIADISSSLQKVRCERASERVGRYRL